MTCQDTNNYKEDTLTKEETKDDTNGVKKKDDLDIGWESTRRKMKDLEESVMILKEKMNKLTDTYSNPVVVAYKCMKDDKEESKVEMKEKQINQDNYDVTLAPADDMTISAHKLVLSNIKLDISDVTLVCEDQTSLAKQIVFLINNQSSKEEIKFMEALLYKKVPLKLEGQNKNPSKKTSPSVKEPDRKSELLLFQSSAGEFLQRPPPSPPYYFPPSPPQYEGSPGHQDYGQNYGGLVQDTQCYYERGGQHYK